MCVWNCKAEDRHCEYCSYQGGCETRKNLDVVGPKYLEVMSGIVGYDIRERLRIRSVVWARNMLFYQMAEDGFSESKIGRFMGYDHSSVHYGKEQVKVMLKFPSMFPKETAIWQKFLKFTAL